MKLIDADEMRVFLNRQYENCHGYMGNKKEIYREALRAVKSYLHSEPIFDAVEVVRCRECIHARKLKDNFYGWDYSCKHFDTHATRSNDFCSYGERKENT